MTSFMLVRHVIIYCAVSGIYFITRARCISARLLQQEIDGSNPAGKWIGHGDVCLQRNAAPFVPGWQQHQAQGDYPFSPAIDQSSAA